jgi:hypothetical protein
MANWRNLGGIFFIAGSLFLAAQGHSSDGRPALKRLSMCSVYLAAASVVAASMSYYREPIREGLRSWYAESFAARVEASKQQEGPKLLWGSDFVRLGDYLLDETCWYSRSVTEHVVRRGNRITPEPNDAEAILRVLKLDDLKTGGKVSEKAKRLGLTLGFESESGNKGAIAKLLVEGHAESVAELLAIGIEHQYELAHKESFGSENETFPTLASLAEERHRAIGQMRRDIEVRQAEIRRKEAEARLAWARANPTYVVGGQGGSNAGIDTINAIRARSGLGPLVLDPALSAQLVASAADPRGAYRGLDLSRGGKAATYATHNPTGFSKDFSAALGSSYIQEVILDPNAATVGFATVGGKTVLQVNPRPGSAAQFQGGRPGGFQPPTRGILRGRR